MFLGTWASDCCPLRDFVSRPAVDIVVGNAIAGLSMLLPICRRSMEGLEVLNPTCIFYHRIPSLFTARGLPNQLVTHLHESMPPSGGLFIHSARSLGSVPPQCLGAQVTLSSYQA